MKEFDLNIEKILEDWEVFHAVREVIANALDEQALTNTKDIQIYKENNKWHIVDYGRGLNYHHLTQNENEEKTNSDKLIGRFGVGLKDALATFYRHRIGVLITSKYGVITLKQTVKIGFEDILTLHAQIDNSPHPDMVGTDFCLEGCSDNDIEIAKHLFLKFSDSKVLERTQFGEVIANKLGVAYIYINGVRVSEEPNFLFSYNITSLNAQIKKALNRERTNVGRAAYTSRVKDILKKCSSETVLTMLIDDFKRFSSGIRHDELMWSEIEMLATSEISKRNSNATFVTPEELEINPSVIDDIKNYGFEPIVVSSNLQNKINDYNNGAESGRLIRTTAVYYQEENSKFKPTPIDINSLSQNEREVYDKMNIVLELIGGKPNNVDSIEIVEKIFELSLFDSKNLGMWVSSDRKILIKRSQLKSIHSFSKTLLHECIHATSGAGDISRDFELALTDLIGLLAEKLIDLKQNTAYRTKDDETYENSKTKKSFNPFKALFKK